MPKADEINATEYVIIEKQKDAYIIFVYISQL